MKKNKIVLILAIGVMLSPLAVLNAAVAPVNNTGEKVYPAVVKTQAELDAMRAKLMVETDIIKNNIGVSKTVIEKSLLDVKNQIIKKLSSDTQDKIRVILDKIFNKMNTQIGTLSQVDTKINTNINSLNKEGVNVASAKAQYIIARAALDKATADVLAARTIASEQLSVGTSKEAIRSLVKTAEDSIKNAGSEYMKIIPLISKAK